jgi:hypothetical protein
VEKQGKLTTVKFPSGFVVFHLLRRRFKLRRRRFMRCEVILGGCLGLACGVNGQQPSKPQEYQVKAVYLYNFGRFVEWPAAANPEELFTICVFGRDPFGDVLDATLAGETIDNQKLVARRISSLKETPHCRILFVSSSEAPRTREILKSVEKSRTLTVSDMPNFTANGGMIQFVVRDNKVRFEVNLRAAEKAGLSLSSQLLKVATDIRNEPGHVNENQ